MDGLANATAHGMVLTSSEVRVLCGSDYLRLTSECLVPENEQMYSDHLLQSLLKKRVPYRYHALCEWGLEYEVPVISESAWRFCYQNCWACGEWGVDLHHMCRKPHSKSGVHDPVNFFAACRVCHEGRVGRASHASQVRLKWLHDRQGYALLSHFLQDFCRLRGVDGWLTVEDVENSKWVGA